MSEREDLQVVVVKMASEEYALPITRVKDINRILPITKMPQTPSFMEGIVNLRGEIIPIVDLRERFHLPVIEETPESRIVIVEFKHRVLGMIVDGVEEVITIPGSDIDLPPAAAKLDQECVNAVGKVDGRLLILLDIDKIFTDEEIKDINKMNG